MSPIEGPPAPRFERFELAKLLASRSMGTFERVDRPRDHLYASELGYCSRAAWLSWHHPRPHDLSFANGRGAAGKALEAVIEEKLRPILVAREVSFTSERVSGRADFVVRFKQGGPQVPIEMKTTLAFERSLRTPLEAHVLQLRFYIRETRAPYGLLLYYDLGARGLGDWAVLKVPRDDASLEARIDHLWRVVHEEQVEPKCDAPDPTDCFPCQVADRDRSTFA